MAASQYQVLYSSFFLEKVILSYHSVFETKTMINWFSLVYTMIFKRLIKGLLIINIACEKCWFVQLIS